MPDLHKTDQRSSAGARCMLSTSQLVGLKDLGSPRGAVWGSPPSFMLEHGQLHVTTPVRCEFTRCARLLSSILHRASDFVTDIVKCSMHTKCPQPFFELCDIA